MTSKVPVVEWTRPEKDADIHDFNTGHCHFFLTSFNIWLEAGIIAKPT